MSASTDPTNPIFWGNDGISVLSAVRLGQPADRLFQVLSPSVEDSLGYIHSAVSQGHPLVKLIVGEMGSGKTTLNKVFAKTATDAGAKVVGISLPYSSSVRELNVISDMISPIHLVTACIEAIQERVSDGDRTLGAAIGHAFYSHRFCAAYQAVVNYYVRVADGMIAENELLTPEWIAQNLSEGITSWLQGERSTKLKEFVFTVSEESQIFGPVRIAEAINIFTGSLKLFRLLKVYPVWMLDEFESVGGLSANKQQQHLGMYRDMVDMIYTVSWASLMMFSTPDGVQVIRRYPALYDRLQGPADFLMTSPTWETKQFSAWEPDTLISVFRSLYVNAAGQGDYVAGRVINNLSELECDSFKSLATEIAQANSVLPRLRLKEFVFAIDRLAQGVKTFHSGLMAQNATIIESESSTASLPDVQPNSGLDQFIATPQDYGEDYCRVDEEDDNHPLEAPTASVLDDFLKSLDDEKTSSEVLHREEPLKSEKLLDDNGLEVQNKAADVPADAPEHSQTIKITDFYFAPRLTRSVSAGLIRLARLKDLSEASEVAACVSLCRDYGMSIKELMADASAEALSGLPVIDSVTDHRYLDLKAQLHGVSREITASPERPLLHEGKLAPEAPVTNNQLDALFILVEPNPEYPPAALLKKEQKNRLDMLKEDLKIGLISKEYYEAASKEKKVKLPSRTLKKTVKVRIDPFLSIGQLRHFIYCVSLNAGFIPSDRMADQLTLELMASRMGVEPQTSRNGIAFVRTDGFMRLWGRETYYADIMVTDDREYADFMNEFDGMFDLRSTKESS